MKKIIFSIVTLLIGLTLVACGGGTEEDKVDKTYSISFVNYDNSVLQKIDVKEGVLPTYSASTPTRPNSNNKEYTFKEWSPAIVVATKDATYKAVFEETELEVNKFTVTFNVEGGSSIATQKVEEGNKATKPTDPTKADHKFLGWFREDKEFDFDTAISANITLTAKWERIPLKYTITFDSKGGTELSSITELEGTSVKEPNKPTKDGFVFLGWFDHNDKKVEWPITLNSSLNLYAAWNEVVPYGEYLKALLENYKQDIYDYIPETMQPGHNLIDATKANLSFDNFINKIDIPYGGYGEQWQMVIDNLNQTQTFFNVLNVIDSLSSASIVAFNNYLDSNPADSSSYEFTESIYQVSIKFEDKILYYILDYTANIPLLGEQTVQIALDYNIETLVKNGRIQLGEANVIKYEFGEDHFTLALRYLGVRRTYFDIRRDEDDAIEGQIFEYLEVAGNQIKSVANFYIDEDYVSVVGTKADGIMLMDSYINELYDVSQGKLLGYEVKETKTVLGFSGTFNTMWFNLSDVLGINSIKIINEENGLNSNSIYINNSTSLFATENVGIINRSRKYDIELRTQYFYYQDGEELVKVKLEIPMLFVQEEQLDDFESSVKNKNKTDIKISLNNKYIDKIQEDYDILIDVLIEDIDLITVEDILEYIGSKYEH